MTKLDRIDSRIVEALQESARFPVTRLAALTNLSVSPCWQRVKRLERSGIIRGYAAEIFIGKLQPVQTVLAQGPCRPVVRVGVGRRKGLHGQELRAAADCVPSCGLDERAADPTTMKVWHHAHDVDPDRR